MNGETFENWAGGVPYKQPPKGWTGKALNVGPSDQTWLGTGKDAWPIAYHGIGGELEFVIPKVVKAGLRPGWNNAFTNYPAIYCSPDFDVALSYASRGRSSTIEGDSRIVIQCRVNPATVNKHTPQVWTVKDAADIKPYRIIIKKN